MEELLEREVVEMKRTKLYRDENLQPDKNQLF